MCAEIRGAFLLPLILGLLLPAAPAGAVPEIQHWSTRNGAQVYFVETHELPIVDIQVVFAAGSARDPEKLHGLALLTNSLLDEGAGGMDADAVAFEFERVGARYDASARYDSASSSLRSLSAPDKLGTAAKNFERVLARPDFPQDALERQRKRFLITLQQKQQSPGALADDAFEAAIYGDHPYGHPSEGDADSLNRITRADVVEFHKRYYTARNAIIAIVGDLNRGRARALAAQVASALPRGQAAPPLPPVPALAEAKTVRVPFPSKQMHVLVGQPGMAANDPDYFPLYVGNHVLGGGGFISRLFEQIREERGLSYSASSYFEPRRQEGPFVAGIQTRADQAPEALELMHEILRKFIEEGPTEKELEASKKNITGGFPLRLDSNREILAYVALIGFYGLPLDYLNTFNRKVEAVTAGQIRDAFRRRLDPDRMATVMVGPVGEAASQK